MADMTIDEATADTTITGAEKIPASDGGAAKSVTVAQIRDFIVSEIASAEAATGISTDADGIYVSIDGVMKTLPAEKLAKAILDYACLLVGIVGPNGNEIFVIDDAGTKKTITLSQITSYITSNAGSLFSSLSSADTMAASDKVMVKQSGTVKEGTLGNLAAFALSTFATFLGDCVNVLNVQTTDKIVVVSGGVTKWMTVAQLASALETGTTVPSTTTAGNIPTYSNTTGGLGTGLAVQATVRAQGSADNNSVPTEAAVRAAIADATSGHGTGDVTGPSSTTQGKIPTWDSTQKKLTDGKTVVTAVGVTGADTAIPTEKAVRDAVKAEATARDTAISNAVSDKVTAPSSTTQGNLPQWDSTQKKLTDGKTVVQSVGSTGSNANIPTEKAVRDAIAAATANTGTGDVTGPVSTTEDKVPQWDATAKRLKDGLTVTTSVSGSPSDAKLPTEKAVCTAIGAEASARNTAIETATGGLAKAPTLTTENKVPQWDNTQKKLKDGLSVVTSVGLSGADTALPTEKAVRTAISEEASARNTAISTATTNMVSGPVSTTEDSIPQWDSTTKTLKDGLTLATSIDDTGSDSKIPTEKAVRDAIDEASGVAGPDITTENKVPQWDSTSRTLKDGLSVVTLVGNSASASNTAIPTEKAVRDALDGLVGMPSTHTENAIPTWGSGSELKADMSVVPSTTGIASSTNASDVKIPTEKAVRDAMPVAATTTSDGLMSASDKAKLNNLTDMSALDEIDANLSDSDTIQVRKSDTTWKKSLLSRFWTYISGKLASFKIDDLAVGDDNTDLNTSTSKHGLCPKLSGNTAHFLRGDGTFASPPGSTVFTGTDGVNAGSNGLVPAPAAADDNKFLNSDGTWKSIAAAEAEEVAPEVLAIERYDTVFIPAAAMVPSASNGAAADAITFTNTKRDTMKFGTVYDDSCEFDLALPDDWNKGSLKAKFLWTVNDSLASSSTNVKWGIGCRATADGESVSTAPTTFEAVTDTLSQVNNLHRTDATDAFTPEGTSGDGNLIHFTVRRMNANPPSSPMSKEALLFGVIIQFARTSSLEAWS